MHSLKCFFVDPDENLPRGVGVSCVFRRTKIVAEKKNEEIKNTKNVIYNN